MKKLTNFSVGTASILCASQAFAGSITFTDGDFQDSDWSVVEVIDQTPNNSFTFSGTRIAVGGNPGGYRRAVNQLNTNTGSQIGSGYFQAGAVFDPGEDGSFLSFDVSLDGISEPTTAAGAMAYGLVLEQGGNYFRVGLGQVLNGAGWLNLSSTGLTSGDFIPETGGVLDLSDSDSAISLGVLAFNGIFGTPSVNSGGFDNWSVTVNTVSEPGALLLLGAGLAQLSFWRTRARR